MVILGGMGSMIGVIIAAILLTILPELLRGVSEYRMIIYALLLIIMMLLRPQGLFGVKLKRRKNQKKNPKSKLLEIKNVTMRFGGLTCVDKLNAYVEKVSL